MLEIKVVKLFCIYIYDLGSKTYTYAYKRHIFNMVLKKNSLMTKICD
jgi:hypothetical protein